LHGRDRRKKKGKESKKVEGFFFFQVNDKIAMQPFSSSGDIFLNQNILNDAIQFGRKVI